MESACSALMGDIGRFHELIDFSLLSRLRSLAHNDRAVWYSSVMRVISRRTLRLFWELYPTSRPGLMLWYERIVIGQFLTFNELRQTFPSADLVGNFIVFNIGGDNFRLITYLDFESKLAFIRAVLIHSEYDKEKWKNDNWYKNS